jgi:hypothetical protein
MILAMKCPGCSGEMVPASHDPTYLACSQSSCDLCGPREVLEALMKRLAESEFHKAWVMVEERLGSSPANDTERLRAETFTPHAVMNEAERLLREAGVHSVLFHFDYRVAITRENDNIWAGSLAEGYEHLAERAKEDEGG